MDGSVTFIYEMSQIVVALLARKYVCHGHNNQAKGGVVCGLNSPEGVQKDI